MPLPPASLPPNAPSDYVRLEAQMAAADPDPARLTCSRPLVLVAESDPDVRAWVAVGLTACPRAEEAAVEAVGTAEELADRLTASLRSHTPTVVLCGHLVASADWPALLHTLLAATGTGASPAADSPPPAADPSDGSTLRLSLP